MEDIQLESAEDLEVEVVPTHNAIVDTYTTKQMADLLQVGMTSAGKVMREIKSVSDTLGITGLVHVQDYEYWLKERLGKGSKYSSRK